MTKGKVRKAITEQIFEARYAASGTFLDIRGCIADYIKASKLFPYWNIDSNIVRFRDSQKKPKSDSAFIGYKSCGYIVFNASTKNYFTDKSKKFWKILNENKHYEISDLSRLGIRTKVFFPLAKEFEEIRDIIYSYFFTETSRKLVGDSVEDFQLVIDYKEENFKVFLRGGPVKEGEAKRYFNFESEEFKANGLFLDLDFFKTGDIPYKNVSNLVERAIEMTWRKLDTIFNSLGF